MSTDQSRTTDGSARDEELTGSGTDSPAAEPAEQPKPAEQPTPAEQPKPATEKAATEQAKATAGKGGKPAAGDDSAEERWSAFVSAEEPAPGPAERARAATARFLAHEWTLAALASLLLAVVMTWPTLRYPLHTIPQDYWDPSLQAWQMAWSGHILLTEPAMLWHANTFYPESWSFAFSDTLLGYAPAGMLGEGEELVDHLAAGVGPAVLVGRSGEQVVLFAEPLAAHAFAAWLQPDDAAAPFMAAMSSSA